MIRRSNARKTIPALSGAVEQRPSQISALPLCILHLAERGTYIVAAQRCTLCNLNYELAVERCKVCHERTWYIRNEDPDEHLQDRINQLIEQQTKDAESIYPHRHDAHARIYSGKGLLWVTHAELLDNGYRSVETGTILFLNGNFYEVHGFSETAESWWIEEVKVDGAAESLEPAMFGGSESA